MDNRRHNGIDIIYYLICYLYVIEYIIKSIKHIYNNIFIIRTNLKLKF